MQHTADQKSFVLNTAIDAYVAEAGQTTAAKVGELARVTFEAGYLLGRQPVHHYTEEEIQAIKEVLLNGRWNWGTFAQAMGALLKASDLGNARKLAAGFPNEFAGWLELSKQTA